MEHHDFPFINSSSLPMISKIAPEYYNELPQLKSYLLVLKDFIFDPNIGKHISILIKVSSAYFKVHSLGSLENLMKMERL